MRDGVDLRNYVLVTGAYWADTIADGASRMLVLFYFYSLGYSPLKLASLFIFYEVFGVITNLVGGWLAARLGLRTTLLGGLAVQLVALGMLAALPRPDLSVALVMVAQALSGIAKDLTKMSSKSAVKLVVTDNRPGALYRWVAILTGSKNALKGFGFFVGALGLTLVGFRTSMLLLGVMVSAALLTVLALMRGELGRPDAKAKFRQMFSNNHSVDILAGARIFLFASRDVWFVVALPVFLESEHHWSFYLAGGFLAMWTIGYGMVQAVAPRLLRRRAIDPDGDTATLLAFALAVCPVLIALALAVDLDPIVAVVVGLLLFGVAFAMNSAVHSYLILAYADGNKVAMNVGFYYMANAGGRLAGTVLSGALYQWQGLESCLWASAAFVLAAAALSRLLPACGALAAPIASPVGA
jgi:predicted MFS family arabinose efflux permease